MEKVFVAKYALSDGITEEEVVEFEHKNIRIKDGNSYYGSTCIENGKWFRTREEAIAKAEKMRSSKIRSLQRLIGRLEEKKFY